MSLNQPQDFSGRAIGQRPAGPPVGGARPRVGLQAPPGPPVQQQPQQVQFQPAQQVAFQPAQQAPQAIQLHAPQPQQAPQQPPQQPQQPARPGGQSVTGGIRPGMANPNDPNLKPLERLFALMAQYDASDLHLKANNPPIMRVRGEMRPLQSPPLSSDDIMNLMRPILDPDQQKTYDETGDLDFAHMLPDQARQRFRLNIFRDRRNHCLVARRINSHIPSFEELRLPVKSMTRILEAEDGLVILAGVTGSGKSTTIAGMIDWINATDARHIITVEDPIEFEFKNKRSFISQREIGVDVMNFKAAIRTLVRQDPDVILIGEMRDAETVEFGLTAAETGHLVFGTLHAGTVPQTISRIMGLFPSEKHHQIRQGLSYNLRAIVCQKLVPSPTYGRVPMNEIMVCSPIVKKILAEGEDGKLMGVIKGGRDDGMMSFDQHLLERVKAGEVAEETALGYATNPEQFKLAVQGIELGGNRGGIVG